MLSTTRILVGVLILECLLVFSLRRLGWFGTGDAIKLVACIALIVTPLILAAGLIARNGLRFGTRSLLIATALVALFLGASLMPLMTHRSARKCSIGLVSQGAAVNDNLDWYAHPQVQMVHPVKDPAGVRERTIPFWLRPLTKQTAAYPADSSVRSVWLDSDEQIRTLAENWQHLPLLQVVCVNPGVSDDGFALLREVLPKIEHLDCVHINELTPPEKWYESLTYIRVLRIWSEGRPGAPVPAGSLSEIAALPKLEVLMVNAYGFNDADAHVISASSSLKRIILRDTAVTRIGEAELMDEKRDRIVYRY